MAGFFAINWSFLTRFAIIVEGRIFVNKIAEDIKLEVVKQTKTPKQEWVCNPYLWIRAPKAENKGLCLNGYSQE